jgi:hypothetical protein
MHLSKCFSFLFFLSSKHDLIPEITPNEVIAADEHSLPIDLYRRHWEKSSTKVKATQLDVLKQANLHCEAFLAEEL